MSTLLNDFLDRTEFDSYKDLRHRFSIHIPTEFNFAYDVVDKYAEIDPNKEALVWCDDQGEEHIFSFKDLSEASKKTAKIKIHKNSTRV